jgi:hypothetical protein
MSASLRSSSACAQRAGWHEHEPHGGSPPPCAALATDHSRLLDYERQRDDQSATLVPAVPLTMTRPPFTPAPNSRYRRPGVPKRRGRCPACRSSTVDPVQVNLPTEWNGSSIQFGGGGFNGG